MDAVAEHRVPDALEFTPEALTSAVSAALIAALNAELSARHSEPGATHFRLDRREVAPGTGSFLVARCFGRLPRGIHRDLGVRRVRGVARDEYLPGKGAVNHRYLVFDRLRLQL